MTMASNQCFINDICASISTPGTLRSSTILIESLVKDVAALKELTKQKEPPVITNIKILNPNKVIGFTFNNNQKIKTICDDHDTFDLEYACFLAYAKLLYSKDYTFEGVLIKARELSYQKQYIKLVKEGLKKYKESEKEKEKAEQLKKEQKERNINKQKKKEAKAAKRREKKLKQTTDIVKAIKETINE